MAFILKKNGFILTPIDNVIVTQYKFLYYLQEGETTQDLLNELVKKSSIKILGERFFDQSNIVEIVEPSGKRSTIKVSYDTTSEVFKYNVIDTGGGSSSGDSSAHLVKKMIIGRAENNLDRPIIPDCATIAKDALLKGGMTIISSVMVGKNPLNSESIVTPIRLSAISVTIEFFGISPSFLGQQEFELITNTQNTNTKDSTVNIQSKMNTKDTTTPATLVKIGDIEDGDVSAIIDSKLVFTKCEDENRDPYYTLTGEYSLTTTNNSNNEGVKKRTQEVFAVFNKDFPTDITRNVGKGFIKMEFAYSDGVPTSDIDKNSLNIESADSGLYDKPFLYFAGGGGGSSTDLTGVKSDIANNKSNIASNTSDITTLKRDVLTVKGDVSTAKSDVGTNKNEINTLKSEDTALKSEINNLSSQLSNTLRAIGSNGTEVQAQPNTTLQFDALNHLVAVPTKNNGNVPNDALRFISTDQTVDLETNLLDLTAKDINKMVIGMREDTPGQHPTNVKAVLKKQFTDELEKVDEGLQIIYRNQIVSPNAIKFYKGGNVDVSHNADSIMMKADPATTGYSIDSPELKPMEYDQTTIQKDSTNLAKSTKWTFQKKRVKDIGTDGNIYDFLEYSMHFRVKADFNSGTKKIDLETKAPQRVGTTRYEIIRPVLSISDIRLSILSNAIGNDESDILAQSPFPSDLISISGVIIRDPGDTGEGIIRFEITKTKDDVSGTILQDSKIKAIYFTATVWVCDSDD